jgi:hypothetical protein
MRFCLGPIPEDATFDPVADGWTRLREPRPGLVMLVAIPLGILMAGVLALAWSAIVPLEMSGGTFSFTITLPGLLLALLSLAGLIAAHELLHAVPAMVYGTSDGVVIGFWPRYLAPYVAYLGVVPRRAQLLSGVAPLVVLTALPLVVALILPAAALPMAAVSVANVAGSAADLLMLALLWRQVPTDALVRNNGHATWWRQRSAERATPDVRVA